MAEERIGQVLRTRLDNGLTVVAQENHAAPVVAVQVWVEVGSADETKGEEGLAHLHEHMLFKGTPKRGVGEIASAIESAGGEINAWTSFDHTVYHVVLASRFMDLGMEVLADAVQNALFDASELEREKRVVLEEIKRTRDMPGRWLGELIFSTAFQRHSYGHPVLGTSETVAGFSRKEVLKFYRKHYRPARTTVVLVGDFSASDALNKTRRLFGAWRAPRNAKVERANEPNQRKMRVRLVQDDVQEAHLAMAWHIPDAKHSDVPALDLLATLLGQGDSSRLSLGLKRGLNLVNDAYSYAYTPVSPGLFMVGASCQSARVPLALEKLSLEVARLSTVPVGAAELAKVKSMVESDSLYMRETVQGMARRTGFYQVLMNDPSYGDRYLSQILAVTPADIMRVAQAYLVPKKTTAVLVVPRSGADGGTVLDSALVRKAIRAGVDSAPQALAEDSQEEGGVLRLKIRNGPVVLIQEDHSNALVSLRAVFMGGSRYETGENSGINNFLAGLLTRGTTTRSADDIAREVDTIAGSMDGFSGRNTLGMRAEFPARNLDRGLALFADCLLNSAFREKELKRERELTLEVIASRDDNLAGLAFDLFSATLYDQHPYRRTVLGTRKSVSGFRRKQVQEYFDQHGCPSKMVLSVVGDVDRQRVVDQIRALFSGGALKKKPVPAVKFKADPVPPKIRTALKHRSRAQAHLVLGFMGTTLNSKDRFALEVLVAVLTGQGGRLFVELRDKRSLAYALSGFSLEGIEPGFLAFYIGVEPARIQEALDAFLEQLKLVVDRPVSNDELKRAQRYLVGTQAISLQRTSARAAALAFCQLYGLGHLAYTGYAEQIMSIKRKDLQRVARKYFKLDAYTLSVVGPQEQLSELSAASRAP